MLTKTITYKDLDGNSITEDFYFQISQTDLLNFEMEYELPFGQVLTNIAQSNDKREILRMMDVLLGRAYGIRSDDRKRFIKNPNLWDEFKQMNAHTELIVELFGDASSFADFVKAMLPAEMRAQMEEAEKVQRVTHSEDRPVVQDHKKKQK